VTLDKQRFWEWGKAGHGRAFLMVQEHGAEAFRSELDDLCRNDYSFLGESHAPVYFARMIDCLDNPEGFRQRLWSALRRRKPSRGRDHLLKLAQHYAKSGDRPALDAIRTVVRQSVAAGRLDGVEELILVCGTDGLQEVLRLVQDASLEVDLKEFPYVDIDEAELLRLLDSWSDVLPVAAKLSRELRSRDARRKIAQQQRKAISVREWRSLIDRDPDQAGKQGYETIRKATSLDLKWLADYPPTEERALLEWLRVWSRKPFPGDLSLLMRHARQGKCRIRVRALAALEEVRSQEVRQLALDLLDSKYDIWAAGLLVKNYQPGDEERLIKRAQAAASRGSRHSFTLRLRDLVDEVPGLSETLCPFIYEYSPCAMCRAGAVRVLAKRGLLPLAWKEELVYEANPETAEDVAKLERESERGNAE
jgi:hypothetical protein